MASPYASSAKIAAAEAKLGGPIAQDSSLLLKQLVVALGNVTGGGGGGSGTVTSVSVTTQNGVSATVTNPTTTPALAFTLGAITPTTVRLSGSVSGTTLLQAPAVAGSAVITFPSVTSTLAIIGNPLSQFASTTSAQLASIISDKTGSGSLVFATSPTLVTPLLGTPTSGTLTNCTGLPVSSGISGLGAGVATALAVNVGSAGAVVVNGGVLGTPSSGALTNCTSLPVSTGISGLGTGVATALAVNTGSAGAFVVNGGALSTPSSGTLTNCTGLPISTGVSGLGTGVAATLATNLSITGGGTISLGGFTLTVPATGTAALLATANAFTAAQSITAGSNSATPAAGLTVQNTTAATAGTQSASPYTVWTGYGWKTTATAGSQDCNYRAYVLPVQGSANPTANWVLQRSINGESFADAVTISGAYNNVDTTLTLNGRFGTALSLGTNGQYGTLSLNSGGFLISNGGTENFFISGTGPIVGSNQYYAWTSASGNPRGTVDTWLGRKAAASIQLGQDAAGVTNQLLTAANRITSDGVGANLTIAAGNGRGAAGGSLILSTFTTAGAGTAGTQTARITIDTAGVALHSNCDSAPAGTPSGGGYLYAEAGALKWKGSSGTVTTLAAA